MFLEAPVNSPGNYPAWAHFHLPYGWLKYILIFLYCRKLTSQGHPTHQSLSKTSKTRLERRSICSHGMIKRTIFTVKCLYYTQLNVYFFWSNNCQCFATKIVGKNLHSVSRKHIFKLTRNFNEGTQWLGMRKLILSFPFSVDNIFKVLNQFC